jgi:hypothetical protein
MSLFANAIQRGTRSAQPAATAVVIGTLYYVTDESKTERSNGTTWDDYTDAGGGAGAIYNTKTPGEVTGLIGWWEAAAITGLSDGDPVATWPDQAATPHNLTQSSAGQKPLYKTNQANGLPGVRFDDSDDGMNSTLVISNPFSVIIVANNRNIYGGSSPTRWFQGKTTGVAIGIARQKGSPNNINAYSGELWFTAEGSIGIDTNFRIVAMTQQANDQRLYTDGTMVGRYNFSTPNAPGANGFSIGYTGYEAYPGSTDMIEMLIYDSVISNENRRAVEQGLRQKYSLS